MKFTVLMPVYYKDRAEWLDKALNSITYEQSVKPDQIVLVEDGPIGDELKKVISKYSKFITSVRLQENKGVDFALNEGIKFCKNEWIARMDSDDISHPDRFKMQIEYIKKNDDIDVVGTALAKFIDDPRHITSIIYRKEPYKLVKFRTPMSHATVFYKKSRLLSVGAYEGAPKLMEDNWLFIKMISKGFKMHTLSKPLYYMRSDNNVNRRRGGWSFFKNELKIQNELFRLGLINIPLYLRNIVLKGGFRLAPTWIRGILYNKIIGSRDAKSTLK